MQLVLFANTIFLRAMNRYESEQIQDIIWVQFYICDRIGISNADVYIMYYVYNIKPTNNRPSQFARSCNHCINCFCREKVGVIRKACYRDLVLILNVIKIQNLFIYGSKQGKCSSPTSFLFPIAFYGFFIHFLMETNIIALYLLGGHRLVI